MRNNVEQELHPCPGHDELSASCEIQMLMRPLDQHVCPCVKTLSRFSHKLSWALYTPASPYPKLSDTGDTMWTCSGHPYVFGAEDCRWRAP